MADSLYLLVLFLARMDKIMTGQYMRVGKRFATDVTCVRSFTGMDTFMLHSTTEIRESSVAILAGIWFLAGVLQVYKIY